MADGAKTADPQTALYAALVKAQASVHAVEKDARNNFMKYNYVSAEQMIREAKEILGQHGLAVVPTASTLYPPIAVSEADSDYAKNARSAATLNAVWTIVHAQGGSVAVDTSWPVAPEKGRPIDKAVAAARTASLSYLLRDLLQIPRVEEGTDLDDNSRDQHNGRGPQPSEASADMLADSIGVELTRLKKQGDERTKLVTSLNDGARPKSALELSAVLKKLRAMPTPA